MVWALYAPRLRFYLEYDSSQIQSSSGAHLLSLAVIPRSVLATYGTDISILPVCLHMHYVMDLTELILLDLVTLYLYIADTNNLFSNAICEVILILLFDLW